MERISKIPLSRVMAAPPVCIHINDPFSRVEELLRVHRIRHLPVVDENRVLCGLITQTDLYRTVSPFRSIDGELFYNKELLDGYLLESAMTKNVTTLTAEDDLASAIGIMVKKRFGCVPIIDVKHRLLGIITQIDILKEIYAHAGWVI
jgi:CBS domain-containing membrane protein